MNDDEYIQFRIENIEEQIRFNRKVIKRLNQRNVELRYIKMGLEEDMKREGGMK